MWWVEIVKQSLNPTKITTEEFKRVMISNQNPNFLNSKWRIQCN